MNTVKTHVVSVLELRRLLYMLKDSGADIGIRFRLLGELWQNDYLRVFQMTDSGALMRAENSDKVIFIRNLDHVMQFELSHRFQQFHPHFHYHVSLSS